jgi:hypothetical protein
MIIGKVCPNCLQPLRVNSPGCESHAARRHAIRRIMQGGTIRVICGVADCDLASPRCKGATETAPQKKCKALQ